MLRWPSFRRLLLVPIIGARLTRPLAWVTMIGITAFSLYDSTRARVPSPNPRFFSFEDKVLHFLGYGVLALAALQSLFTTRKVPLWRHLMWVLGALLVLQCGNEFIQYVWSIERAPEFKRHPEMLDVLAGTLGSGCAILLFWLAKNVEGKGQER